MNVKVLKKILILSFNLLKKKKAAGQTHSKTLSRHAKALVRHTTLTTGITMVLIFKSHNHLTLLQRDGEVFFFALPFLSIGMGVVCKIKFHYVPHVKLEFVSFLSAGIKGVSHHIWQKGSFKN